ncbi:MAG: ABC transporter permease [Erysipelotrichaceae bacterium]|nr:ABC transporter permease [Erysipelotrichaceae bacterium]
MKTLIFFNLKRRFFNRMTLLLNAVLFLVIMFLFHADYFLGNNTDEYRFYIDDSLKEYQSAFLELERDYHISSHQLGDHDVLIHYNRHFTIVCGTPLSEELLEELRSDIRLVVREAYCRRYPALSRLAEEYIDIQVNINQKEKPSDGIWIIGTIVYFLLMNYSSTIASEVVYEKANHLLEGILTSVSPQQHLSSKIIQGYLTVIIQLLLALLYAAACLAVRWLEDGFRGLGRFLGDAGISQAASLSLKAGWPEILLSGAIMISGLMIVQTVMLLICSRLSGSEQAGSLQGVFYVLLLVGYYLLLMNGEKRVTEWPYAELAASLPVISIYLMSCLLVLKRATLIQGLLALGINVVTLLLLIETGGRRYRRNLMRY